MKATELRIGNLILSPDGKIYYVSNLSLDIDDEYNELIGAVMLGKTTHEILKEEREVYWNPIPLTEDWLLKLGFKEEVTYGYGWTTEKGLEFHRNGVSIVFFQGEYAYAYKVYDGGTSDEWYSQTTIKFIHQLQNLYFALTGEELKINGSYDQY